MCRIWYNSSNRGMDVKNLNLPYKVTISAPTFCNLRRDGIGDAVVLSVPLFF